MEHTEQKTILLPLYHGLRAKNFFYTDTYRTLIANRRVRLVVVAPSVKTEYYRNTFNEPNIIFEPLDIDPNKERFFGKLLAEFAFNILDTGTIRFKQLLQYWQYGNLPRFVVKRGINRILGPITPLRSFVRFLDRFIKPDHRILGLFEKYKPSLLMAPDIVFAVDRLFMRAARARGCYTVGLMRSWDNITAKGVIQILPDKLILHTNRMKRQAVKLVGMGEKDIIVTGPPDFDDYFKPMKAGREEFLTQLGIPASRRVVLFTPFFDAYLKPPAVMMKVLLDAIDDGKLPRDLHILLRYRPGITKIPPVFLEKHSHLTITYPTRKYFYKVLDGRERVVDWEFSSEDVDLLVQSVYYSNVMISTVSTLTIDAAACDRPVIGIRFDAIPNCPKQHSIVKIMDLHDHYRELERTGGVRLVKNADELIAALNLYLEKPELDKEGRRQIREEQIEFFDGKNGSRAAECIYNVLYKR